ncbi:MAG: YceI family protein [Candidatus Caenarcaniphilales bacterium]|nr:YceI family protein [Candidatus Caenarcaniphilales bacterium]
MKQDLKLFFSLATSAVLSLGAFADTYKIDETHSTVGFKIKHLGISNVTGKFDDFAGNFYFDPKKPEASKANAKIKLASVNTGLKQRDEHLKNEDFFNVAKNPEMSFESKSVKKIDENNYDVNGTLTLNGVSKPVVLKVEHLGDVKDPWGNERSAFSATTKINRKDYGLSWNKAMETGGVIVGEEVSINLEVEGIKEKAAAAKK